MADGLFILSQNSAGAAGVANVIVTTKLRRVINHVLLGHRSCRPQAASQTNRVRQVSHFPHIATS